MKRYWFQLLTSNYDELNVCIPDGSSKISATNLAKRWMKQNNINSAILAVNRDRKSTRLNSSHPK